jgi:tetratricopeptide (TPR) repeat protein
MLFAEFIDNEARFYHLSLEAPSLTLFNRAETAFENRHYDSALQLYLRLQQEAPSFDPVLTLIGDVHYIQARHDSAAFYYRLALKANRSDYQAHWFLADALWALGDTTEALYQITTAHILNVNHEVLQEVLIDYRARVGRPWIDWSFDLRYEIGRDSARVTIQTDINSSFYAMTKALWAYEPGYADKMLDTIDLADRVLNLTQEREAAVASLLGIDSLRVNVAEKIGADYIQQFVLYEVIAKREPRLMLLLTEESRDLVVEYLTNHH